MDEGFEQQIKNALADPDIMQKVSGVLKNLGGSDSSPQAESSPLGGALPALSSLASGVQDDRTRLLLAIKPFLSEKRAPYMDSAVNILKLVSIGKIGKDLKLF